MEKSTESKDIFRGLVPTQEAKDFIASQKKQDWRLIDSYPADRPGALDVHEKLKLKYGEKRIFHYQHSAQRENEVVGINLYFLKRMKYTEEEFDASLKKCFERRRKENEITDWNLKEIQIALLLRTNDLSTPECIKITESDDFNHLIMCNPELASQYVKDHVSSCVYCLDHLLEIREMEEDLGESEEENQK